MAITEQQLAFKKGKLGASQAAAALGISPFQTQANLYNELLGNIERGDIGAKGRIGNAMEPVIVQEYEAVTGTTIIPSPDTLIHPDHPWMICHLDGEISGQNKILEIKNVGWTMAHHWGNDGDGEGVPMYVMVQCVHQAILANVDRVDVAAFFGGNELRVYPLVITSEAKEAVMSGLINFWDNYVVKKIQPEFTGKDESLLKKLYSNADNVEVIQVESTEMELMFNDYRNQKSMIEQAQVKADLMKVSIMEFMGTAGIMMRGEDVEFTWKKTKDGQKVDWKGVSGELKKVYLSHHPDAIAEIQTVIDGYTTVKPGHRMFLDKCK